MEEAVKIKMPKKMKSRGAMLTAMILSNEQEEALLNPAPGTAAARARDFGIDLTLTIANLRLTPQQRVERLEELREFATYARAAMRRRADKR